MWAPSHEKHTLLTSKSVAMTTFGTQKGRTGGAAMETTVHAMAAIVALTAFRAWIAIKLKTMPTLAFESRMESYFFTHDLFRSRCTFLISLLPPLRKAEISLSTSSLAIS